MGGAPRQTFGVAPEGVVLFVGQSLVSVSMQKGPILLLLPPILPQSLSLPLRRAVAESPLQDVADLGPGIAPRRPEIPGEHRRRGGGRRPEREGKTQGHRRRRRRWRR